MGNRLQELLESIKKLEKEVAAELDKKQEEFFYKIKGRKVRFDKEVKKHHKAMVTHLGRYLTSAAFLNILTAPFIWLCLVPALFLDLTVTVFQAICFRIYGIPRVQRSEYFIIDRHSLSYLNVIEKLNCTYCGYFNGLISFVQEVAARTEQYWCPIKHARRQARFHSRYRKFLEYGDGQAYKENLQKVRQSFEDLD